MLNNSLLLASDVSGENPYQIKRSLRFREAQYLTRTNSATGNRKVLTWSGWVKRGKLETDQVLHVWGVDTSVSWAVLYINAGGAVVFGVSISSGVLAGSFTTTAALRDPSAWYHVVLSMNAATNSIIVYINGVQAAGSGVTLVNQDYAVNTAGVAMSIAREQRDISSLYFDGYLSEVNFIDGQALTPASFGMTDPVTGQWSPIAYAGTYGTNGFYLDFSDPSSTTNLCLDRSGNANNWTPSGISITAGETYDSMLDVPTRYADGGNGRGNYCTLNPLYAGGVTLSAGNLTMVSTASSAYAYATHAIPSAGKYYCEAEYSNSAASISYIGTEKSAQYRMNGQVFANNVFHSTVATFTTADIIGFAFSPTDNTCEYYKNGVLQVALTGLTSLPSDYIVGYMNDVSCAWGFNFGQRPFAHTPPTGYLALHTGNLTNDTVITSGSFTGNAATDGPFVWMNGAPETLTINGNAVTFGTHADKLANGFKLRTDSTSYNTAGTNTWTATVLTPASKSAFRKQLAKANP